MGQAISSLLANKRIIDVISREKEAVTALSDDLGFNVGQDNRTQQRGRTFYYRTFNNTRKTAKGRAPAAPLAISKPQPTGEVFGVFPRAAEQIPLLHEDIMNQSPVAGPVSEVDQNGQDYITRQTVYLGQKFKNLIELQTAGMLRGSYYFHQDGDDLFHSLDPSGMSHEIDFQIPSGNLGGLDMLGDGNLIWEWEDNATDIPAQLFAVNESMQELTGHGLRKVVIRSGVWQYILNNTAIINQGGSSNVVFDRIDANVDANFTAVIRSMPWIKWCIYGHGLGQGVDEEYAPLIENDHASFQPANPKSWCQYIDGSEVVTEGPAGTPAEQYGFHAWGYPDHNPSGWNICGVHNGIPSLTNPKAIAYGDVTTAEPAP